MEMNHAKTTENEAKAPMESEEILEICKHSAEGDEKAQRQLMELLHDRIHRTASFICKNRDDAKDLAQTACIEVLLSVGSYRGEASLTYWSDRVTIQIAAKSYSKRTRRDRLFEKFFQPAPPPAGADDQVARTQVWERLSQLLHTLKYKQREALVLRYIHGYSNQQVADLCNIPMETARARVKKGRAVLKKKVLADPLLAEWVLQWGE